MTGKMVGAVGLNRPQLFDVVGCEYSQIRLMLVDKSRKLETVHRLLRTQSFRQLDKAEQTSSESMSDKQGRERTAALNGYQCRPFARRTLAKMVCQPTNGWMLYQDGVGEPGAEPLFDLNQHACGQQGVAAQGEEVLVEPDIVEFE